MEQIDLLIEKYHDKTGLSYIDSVIDFAEEHNMDLYDMSECLAEDTLKKIKSEFLMRNMVKGQKVKESDLLLMFQR